MGNTEQLIEMGFDPGDARVALQKYDGNLDKAMASLLGEAVPEDELPALISIDDPPAYGPPNSWKADHGLSVHSDTAGTADKWAIAPYKGPPGSVIDLTGDDSDLPPLESAGLTREEEDIQKAIKLSVGEEDEVTQAMEASVLSTGSLDQQTGWHSDWDRVEQLAPELRIRQPDHAVLLRSSSVHLSLLATYLQAIYAVPSFRHAILNFRPSEDEIEGYLPMLQLDRRWTEAALYKDYWKGAKSTVAPSPNANLVSASQFQKLFAVQRLFAIMTLSQRAFVHTTDVEWAWEIDEKAFRWGDGPREQIKAFHHSLIDALQACYRENLQVKVSKEEITMDECEKAVRENLRIFSTNGRAVENNVFIGSPLPPLSAEELENSSAMLFSLVPLPTIPDNIYSALDRAFNADETSLGLLTTIPDVLSFEFTREPSLSLVAGEEKRAFEVQEEIFIDRYYVRNRVEVQKGRERMRELGEEVRKRKEEREELAVTKDGQDALELVQAALSYCSSATSDDPVRSTRQQDLASYYSAIHSQMSTTISEHDTAISTATLSSSLVFDTPSMRLLGPYTLSSLVMRTGLNGRGSAWSYTKDAQGQWWKIVDETQTKVSFEDVRNDKTGVLLDAGVGMAFYQRDPERDDLAMSLKEPVEVPAFLREGVRIDNMTFAQELPSDLSVNWDQPSPAPPPSSPSLLSSTTPDDLLLITPNSPRLLEESIANDDVLPMSIDQLDALPEIPDDNNDDETMRLRGGADNGDEEDEEEDEEEGEDEDEVELGCLKPMEESGEWDIDVKVGKVGGVPKWLDPTSPLEHAQVACGVCGGAMSLLLQLNSPDDERPHAAARTLYVFACRVKECRSTAPDKANKVWRVQLPSPNAFYPHSVESDKRRKELEDALDPTSKLAGPRPSTSTPLVPLPEWDIECDSEPYEESFLTDTTRPHEDDGGVGEDAEAPDTTTGVDKAFLIFQERVERVPEQVLRFYRLPDVPDPSPLWPSSKRLLPSDIPPCTLCNAPRKIEFQILSTLLSFLKEYDFAFDTLLVYTCSENCRIPDKANGGTGWVEEVVVELSFAEDGVNFGSGGPVG